MIAKNLKRSYKKYDNFDTFATLSELDAVESPLQDRIYFVVADNKFYRYNSLSATFEEILDPSDIQNLNNALTLLQQEQIVQNTNISNNTSAIAVQNIQLVNHENNLNNLNTFQQNQQNFNNDVDTTLQDHLDDIIALENFKADQLIKNNNYDVQLNTHTSDISVLQQNTSNIATALATDIEPRVQTLEVQTNTNTSDITILKNTKIDTINAGSNIAITGTATNKTVATITAPTFTQVTLSDIGAVSNNPNIATNNKYVIDNCRPLAGNSITVTPQTAGALSTHGVTIATVQPILTTSAPTFANVFSTNGPTAPTHCANMAYVDRFLTAPYFGNTFYNYTPKFAKWTAPTSQTTSVTLFISNFKVYNDLVQVNYWIQVIGTNSANNAWFNVNDTLTMTLPLRAQPNQMILCPALGGIAQTPDIKVRNLFTRTNDATFSPDRVVFALDYDPTLGSYMWVNTQMIYTKRMDFSATLYYRCLTNPYVVVP